MKKITALFLLATMFAINNAKANLSEPTDVKNQFVKWKKVPEPNNVKVVWLKNAMQGKEIPGAEVRSNSNTYKKVWGEELYNKVLNAEDSRFQIVSSIGGETNWAVNSSGQAVPSGTLDRDVLIITIDNYPIAKWGTNGCLNAISPAETFADDGEDPDNKKPGSGLSGRTYAGGSITNNTIVNNQEISWAAGYGIYSQGRNDRTVDFSNDALMFMAIQKNTVGNCNTCGTTQQSTVSTVTYAQPVMYTSAPQVPVASSANVQVKSRANGWEIANTIANVGSFGLNLYNTVAGQRVRVVGNNRGYYNNTWYPNPTVSYGGGFQGSNQLGASFSGGQFGSSENQFGGTGSWGNTWN